MNSLGRGRTSCAVGLHDYFRRVIRTRVAARRSADAWLAREQLQHLLFDVEVDVAARAGAAGLERMTEVEAAVFQPALLRLSRAIAAIPLGSDPSSWQVPLTKALAVLREAARQLHVWRPESEACA